MNRYQLTKPVSLLFILAFSSILLFAQDCEVAKEEIKGTYTGPCKRGKANGKGKSVGLDSYEGEFKNGLPDGQGTYTWRNNNVFVGKFVKGLKDGKGIMTFKRESAQDSIIEGFWKKDVYRGKYEFPWVVHSKTGSVRDVDVEYMGEDNLGKVKIVITTTSGGVPSVGGQLPRATASNIVVIKGNYERQTTLESHYKSTETTLLGISFPFHIKFNIGSEQVEVEYLEHGSYTTTVSVNQ